MNKIAIRSNDLNERILCNDFFYMKKQKNIYETIIFMRLYDICVLLKFNALKLNKI